MDRFSRLTVFLALFGAAGCGSLPASGGASGDPLTGQYTRLPLPSTEAALALAPMQAQVYAYETLVASGGNDTAAALSTAQTLTTGSSTCAAAGCAMDLTNVNLRGASKGAFVMLTGDDSGATQGLYVPTASMVVNANQLLIASKSNGTVTAQGRALAISKAGLNQLATLTGVDANSLLTRGVAIGFVASSRDFSAGAIPGVARATLRLTNAPSGAAIVYPNDTYTSVTSEGTNSAGAFIAIGGTTPSATGAGQALGLSVSASDTTNAWAAAAIVVVPNAIVAMPILPTT